MRAQALSCIKHTVLLAVFIIILISVFATYASESFASRSTVKIFRYSVGTCDFRISDHMFDGKFYVNKWSSPPAAIYTYPDKYSQKPTGLSEGFTLFCIDATEDKIGLILGAKRVNGQWLEYNPWPRSNEMELTPFDPGAHLQTIRIQGKNWKGIGLTVDETTGAEQHRLRRFFFCLVHRTHALCGNTPVQRLADPGGHSELGRITAILETIEFVESLAPNESGAASNVSADHDKRGRDGK
ncbi:hypothetical protein [Paraburkholderia humisilvae]|uniref:Uncharacterized protein n=1 Tax=Paraburkholderia humisilvae TaxID=627669 RepID=A0A6J5EST9_9BURK|nr:hypothetical protein [Paraburkholderia humisilvae]CAB3768256.1 hypothetical protein LMG29542_05822 [Paraburkholderia humisilvae]